MKVGDTVKFKDGLYQDERDALYKVVEISGDRVIIEFVCDLPIPPQSLARTIELQVLSESINDTRVEKNL